MITYSKINITKGKQMEAKQALETLAKQLGVVITNNDIKSKIENTLKDVYEKIGDEIRETYNNYDLGEYIEPHIDKHGLKGLIKLDHSDILFKAFREDDRYANIYCLQDLEKYLAVIDDIDRTKRQHSTALDILEGLLEPQEEPQFNSDDIPF